MLRLENSLGASVFALFLTCYDMTECSNSKRDDHDAQLSTYGLDSVCMLPWYRAMTDADWDEGSRRQQKNGNLYFWFRYTMGKCASNGV